MFGGAVSSGKREKLRECRATRSRRRRDANCPASAPCAAAEDAVPDSLEENAQEPRLTALPARLNVLLVLEPRAAMAVMQTTMIRASMTAYSTAVGPSSSWRKRHKR